MKKAKTAGKKAKTAGKNSVQASRTVRKEIEKKSQSLKMNLVRGAAALRREVEERTPAVKKTIESGVGKVMHMTGEAATLAKLKVEITSLQNEKEKMLEQLGDDVWHLYQQKRLNAVGRDLAEVFGKLEELTGRIRGKEAEIEELSIT
ncbi:hypothetical protein JW777_01415 [bacterium]|nr:hypothetical protein [bacterium]